MESSFFDTSSTLEYDLELEELIQCVEIGKNAVDKVCGLYVLIKFELLYTPALHENS